MKKTTAILAFLICVVFVFASVTACTPKEKPSGNDKPSETVQYTVTFDVAGGTPIEAKKVDAGKTVERPADPTKNGYEFAGWYADPQTTEVFSFSDPITSDVTVYAKWTKKDVYYTVSFESNGGTAIAAQSVLEGKTVSEPAEPERIDYIFDGWYTDSALTKKFDFGVPITANVTLYAKWLENIFYTVTFHPCENADTIEKTVRKGARVAQPANPTDVAEGYLFAGWYTDEDFNTPFDFTQPVNEDLNVYGKTVSETAEHFTVMFETFEGSFVPGLVVEPGKRIHIPADPTFDNNDFTGWYTDKNCTLPFDFSTGINRNITLYAGWKGIYYYDVVFNTDGGTAIQTERVKGGEKVGRPSTDPEKQGYYFTGWFADSTGTMPFDFDLPIDKDTTVYAIYTIKPFYHVQFDVNGGTPVPEYASVQEGDRISAPVAPTKEGYEFGGWYTDVGLTISAAFPYEVVGNVTFYAEWLADDEYVVVNFELAICNENGAYQFDEPFDMSPITVKRGSKILQPDNPSDMTATDINGNTHNMMFSYWNFRQFYTENGGITVPSVDMILFPVIAPDVEEITLYAVYREVKEGDTRATLAIHPNNGEEDTYVYGIKGQTVGARLDASNHPLYSALGVKPIREGYEITGYYKTPGLSTDTDDVIYQIPFLLEQEYNDCYLRWEKHSDIDIIYDYDRNDGVVNHTLKAPYNGFATRPADPYREGYTFDGWYWEKNNNPENLFDFENTRITSQVISRESSGREYVWLVAKWVANPCTVTFDVGNGVPITAVTVTSGETLGELPTPKRYNYYFDGWYKDSSFSTPFTADEQITSDITIYAKWVATATDISMFKLTLTNGGYDVTLADHVNRASVEELVIPAAYGNYPVHKVYGFSDMQNLKRVVIPETVTTINIQTFSNCSALESVEIEGRSLRAIGFDAFKGCTSLSSVTFADEQAPYGLTDVFADIFRDSPAVREQFEEENGLYYWYDILLGDYSSVTSQYFSAEEGTLGNISIREGTRVIAALALYNQVAATSLTIPEGVKYVKYMALPWSETLKSLYLPSTLISIDEDVPSNGERMFSPTIETISVASGNRVYEVVGGCLVNKSLSRVIASEAGATRLPAGYRSIGVYAFTEKQLDTVAIPSSYIEIMANAFNGCAFTTLTIPDNVGILSSTACADCNALTEISFGSSVNTLEASFFTGMKALCMISVSEQNNNMYSLGGILYNQSDDEIICVPYNLSGDVVFREGITELPYDIFTSISANAQITSIVFPDSLVVYPDVRRWGSLTYVYIGAGAAEDTFEGTSVGNWYNWFNRIRAGYAYTPFGIEISPECGYMYSNGHGGIVTKADGMLLYVYTDETSALVLDDGIVSINPEIDFTQYWFESIHIGSQIDCIEDLPIDTAYVGEITVSEDNPYYSVKDGILYDKGFTSFVLIPVGLNRDVVELPKELTEIPAKAFYLGDGYDESGPFFGINPYPGLPFDSGIRIGKLTVEEGSQLTAIGSYAFAGGDYLSGMGADSVIIESVDFSNATNLVSIDGYAFHASALKDAVFGNVVEIGDRAFEYCTRLSAFTVASGLTDIGTAAFSGCTSLSSVALPESVTNVGSGAFYNCGDVFDEKGFIVTGEGKLIAGDSLKTGKVVAVGDNVREIISNVFYGWFVLYEITIPASVEVIGANAFGNNDNLVIKVEAAQKPEGWDDAWNGSGESAVTAVVWDCNNNQFAEDGTAIVMSDGIRYKLFADKTARVITQMEPVGGAVTIPSQVTFAGEQYSVKAIDGGVFENNDAITSVVIEEGVETIGDRAFGNAENLASLTLPDSLVSVGDYAFLDTAITTVTVKAGTTYGNGAFSGNTMLTSVTIEEGVTEIPDSMFRYSGNGLTSVTLPSTVARIGVYAFASSKSLGHVDLPASLREIANSAFASTALTEIDFSELTQLTTIGVTAFAGTKLTSVTVPRSVNYGKQAFDIATLTSATIAVSGVIPAEIFGSDSKLTSLVFTGTEESSIADCTSDKPFIKVSEGTTLTITFNPGMKYVGDYAFYKAGSIDPIFNEGLEKIGVSAFGYDTIVSFNTPSTLKEIGATALRYAQIGEITFAEGLEIIGSEAFYNTLHPDVVLPASIKRLDAEAFANSINGTVEGKLIISGEYPNLTSLGKYATQRAEWSDTVVLGSETNGVTVDGNSSSMSTVRGSGSVNLTLYVKSVGNYAFKSSSLLKSLKLIGVGEDASVGEYAFYDIRELLDVYLENISDFGVYAFATASTSTTATITDVTIGSGVKNLGTYIFYCVSSLRTLTFETNEVTDIGDYAFYKTNLNSVVLPSSVRNVGKYAFAQCKSLSGIVLNDGLLSLGDFALYGSTVTEVTMPSTLTTVGTGIFYSCNATVTVPFAEGELPEGWSTSWNNKNNGTVIYRTE